MKLHIPSTAEERTSAAACHLISIVAPYLAPLIFYYWRRNNSRFVALHASQAFFEALVLNIVLIVALGISLGFTIANIHDIVQSRGEAFTWQLVVTSLLKAVSTWIILGLISAYYFVASLLDAFAALRGEWKGSIISGRLALRAAPPVNREVGESVNRLTQV